MTLKGKVAVVTGGNSGIGKAVVLELARQGANIVIDYVVHPEATEEVEKQIAALGDRSIGVLADVSKVADLEKLIGAAVKAFGRVDIMVNNAGVETRTSVLDTTEAQYDKVMQNSLAAPLAGNQSFNLDQYVVGKTMDGLFYMLGQEEKKIRKDPAAQVTSLLKEVFGRKQ